MADIKHRRQKTKDRHARLRMKVKGTTEVPRFAVFKSAKHIYAQVIDDVLGVTLAHTSTLSKALVAEGKEKKPTERAILVGTVLAQMAKDKGVLKVVFDRGGFPYKGRVKALADAARKGGLKF